MEEGSSRAAYIDEEDCLGFKIWVAELELIVAGSKGKKKPDAAQVFTLLQKLVVTLDRTERDEVKEYQRRCEAALIDVLLKGAPPPVRRLIGEALGTCYARGDQLPLFSRVSTLQLFLGTREAFSKETAEDVRLGALELTSALYYRHGRSLSIGVLETAGLAARYCVKGASDKTRRAALRLFSAAIEGVGLDHRHAVDVQNEAIKTVEKISKEKDVSDTVKQGIADVLRAVATTGGAVLWTDRGAIAQIVKTMCLHGVHDPALSVRTAYATALAHLIRSAGPAEVNDGLVLPYAEAVARADVDCITTLALCWVRYLRLGPLVNSSNTSDEGNSAFLESHALLPLDALALGCPANGSSPWTGLDNDLGAALMEGERPHAEACTLHILRAGVVDTLGEGGQRALLSRLAERLSNKESSPPPGPVVCVGFRAAAMVMDVLGGVDAQVASAIERAVAMGLSSLLTPVRNASALTLASLAKTRPSSASRLLGSALSGLKSAADALLEATRSGFGSSSKVSTGVPRGPAPVAARLRGEMNALHGWAVASAALLATLPDLPLGVPSHYLSVAIQLGSALVEAPRTLIAPATAVEREAGYILLKASCQTFARLSGFSIFPSSVRVKVAVSAPLVFPVSSPTQQSTRGDNEALLSCDLWWRAAGVDAIIAAVEGGVVDAGEPVTFLIPLLKSIAKGGDTDPSSNTNTNTNKNANANVNGDKKEEEGNESEKPSGEKLSKFESNLYKTLACPQDSRPQLAGAAATFLVTLLRLCNLPGVFSILENSPETMKAIAVLCTRSIVALPFSTSSPFQGSTSIFLPALRAAIPEDDAGLWDADGSTSAETELLRGIVLQRSSLSSSLYEVQARLLGRVLQATNPSCRPLRCAVVEELTSLCNTLPASSSHRETRRITACLAAAPPLLFAFGSKSSIPNSFLGLLNHNSPSGGEDHNGKTVMDMLLSLAEVVMMEAALMAATQKFPKIPLRLLRIVAAELFASVSRIEEQGRLTSILIDSLCKRAAETPSLTVREVLSLGIGAAARSGGPLALSGSTPKKVIDTLIALTAASDPSLAPATLHSLRTCAASAGPAFAPHVPATLSLTTRMLLHQEVYSIPGLLPALGRLANAIVAALGPDYVLGSPAYEACRSVVSELRAPGNPDALSSSLEVVLYAQMMALFAPKALPTATHVAVLIATLPSKQPKIRKAVADTLRHVAERETDTVLALGVKVRSGLFEALNEETDDGTASQLRAVLTTLLKGGAPRQPGEWITMCGDIVTAKGPSSAADAGNVHFLEEKDVEENPVEQQQPQPASPLPFERAKATQPRARTRAFAADCLLSIANNKDIATSKLAAHASELVDLGFKMATAEGAGSSLRPQGVRLLSALLSSLGDVPDPFSPNPSSKDGLLAQYRAQYVATLRSSLSPRLQSGSTVVVSLGESAGPEVTAAATALAAGVIEKGLVGKEEDAGVLERLMALMCSPLSLKEYDGEMQYAEWVGAGTRIAVLEFHARCAVLKAGEKAAATVWQAQGPFLTLLVDRWIGLLHDGIVLEAVVFPTQQQNTSKSTIIKRDRTQVGHSVQASTYRMALYGSTTKSAKTSIPLLADLVACEGVTHPLRRAWPVALDAATAVLLRDRTVSHGTAGRERHAALMDMALIEISRAGNTSVSRHGFICSIEDNSSNSTGDCGRLVKALHSLSRCLGPRFLKAGWVDSVVLSEHVIPLITSRLGNPSCEVVYEVAFILAQVSAGLDGIPGGDGVVEALAKAAIWCLSHEIPTSVEPSLATLAHCLALARQKMDAGDDATGAQVVRLTCRALAAGLEVLALKKSAAVFPTEILGIASKHVGQTAVETVAAVRAGSQISREIDRILVATVEKAAAQTEAALMFKGRYDLVASNLACILGVCGVVGEENVEVKCAALVARAIESVDELSNEKTRVFEAVTEFFKRAPPPLWARRVAVTVIRPVMALLRRIALEDGLANTKADQQLDVLTDVAVQACCVHGEMGKAVIPVLVAILIGLGDRFPAPVVSAMGTLGTDPTGRVAFRETVAALPNALKSKLQEILLSIGNNRLETGGRGRDAVQGEEVGKKLPSLSLARFAS